jgi:hypothetical protein
MTKEGSKEKRAASLAWTTEIQRPDAMNVFAKLMITFQSE